MARKKVKNMQIEQEELKPVTIGVFESRRKSSWGIFIIMTVFVLAVIFMPEISNFVNKYLNTEPQINNPSSNPINPVVPPEEEEPEQVIYDLSEDLIVKDEEIALSAFNIDAINNTLAYNIENISNASYRVTDKNYYIELYDENQTLLQRIKIISSGYLNAGSNMAMNNALNLNVASNVRKIAMTKKDVLDYPPLYLTPNDEGVENLVCSSAYEEVTYIFKENKLKTVISEVNYPKTASNFLDNYNNYRNLAATYNTEEGIVSVFSGSELSDAFNVTTNIDLTKAKRFYVFNADSFALDTEPKVVSFEMEAQGFNCK